MNGIHIFIFEIQIREDMQELKVDDEATTKDEIVTSDGVFTVSKLSFTVDSDQLKESPQRFMIDNFASALARLFRMAMLGL